MREHTPEGREDGLFLCSVCGSAEGATTTECPGSRIPYNDLMRVYAGTLDFIGGEWLAQVEPGHPVAYVKR